MVDPCTEIWMSPYSESNLSRDHKSTPSFPTHGYLVQDVFRLMGNKFSQISTFGEI